MDIVKNVSNWLAINGNGLSQQEQSEFLAICEAYGLNPFKREIYAVKFGGKCQIVVGYETYIKRAEMSGKLAGWEVWTEGKGQDMIGCILIHRKDWEKPFKMTLLYSECRNSKNQLWDSMPSWMLQVRTICRAFRLCFPDCSGLPYIEDEIVTTVAKKTLRDNLNENEYNEILMLCDKTGTDPDRVLNSDKVLDFSKAVEILSKKKDKNENRN